MHLLILIIMNKLLLPIVVKALYARLETGTYCFQTLHLFAHF
jgi:hypothetical protein